MKICKVCLIERPDNMFRKHSKECKACNTIHYRTYRREYFQDRKLKVIQHYGGKCAYCDEYDTDNLQIDHTEGNGRTHRIEMNNGKRDGKILYKWLIDNNYPVGFQVLCKKHNFSKSNMNDAEYKQFIIDTYNYITEKKV